MQGLSTMVGGLLTILGDQEEMRITELTRLANALQNYLGKISQFILPGTKKEFVIRISGMVQEATDPDYRDSLRKLLSVF